MDTTGIYINGTWVPSEHLSADRVCHFQYRGILDYCNFSCSYCPFSKKGYSQKKEEKDRECLRRLYLRLKQEEPPFTFQIVPYGEALLFPYYWEFLAMLSLLPQVPAVGCQTNASFPVKKMLSHFLAYGGTIQKLRLWCTFHPTVISVHDFLHQIQALKAYSVELCVGAVADPSEMESIAQLHAMLPDDIYFWLNKMDGRKQPYTKEEIAFFQSIDPFFSLEMSHFSANPQCCPSKNLFIEANGDFFSCNLSRIRLGNLYEDTKKPLSIPKNAEQKCSRRECSCFLAYQNRPDLIPELCLFSPYPSFRMINKYQAAFFDIDNTLIKNEETELSDRTAKILTAMSRYCDIYLATSLPYPAAIKKCKKIRSLLSGGIFAGGAHIRFFDEKKDHYLFIEETMAEQIADFYKQRGYSVRIYRKADSLSGIYKITAIPKNRNRSAQQKTIAFPDNTIRCYIENCHIQITHVLAEKSYGVQFICRKKGYSPKAILTCGDTKQDQNMAYFLS